MTRKIGIVGGLGWRATAYYYAAFHELWSDSSHLPVQHGAAAPLELVVESLDHKLAHSLLTDGERDGRWDGFDNYHRAALLRLERAEAEIALIACNTPHERLAQISRGTRLDLVDLFETICVEARKHRIRRLLLLGTTTTMASARLRALLAGSGIEPILPDPPVALMLETLIGDVQGALPDDGAGRLLQIVRAMLPAPGPEDAVGLNCTELPLLISPRRRAPLFDWGGMRFLDPSTIHVEAALRSAGHLPPTSVGECRLAD